MSDRFETYRCAHCGFKAQTSARLSSHVSQSPTCLDKLIILNRPSTNPYKRQYTGSPAPRSGGDPGQLQVDDEPVDSDILYSSLLGSQYPVKRARVEDEETPIKTNETFKEFKPLAGEPQQRPPNMSNDFECLRDSQQASGDKPWAPFSSIADWDYAWWITNSGLSQRQIDAMLALDCVRKMNV